MPGGGGGGFTRPIPRDGGADQFRGIPIVGRLPTDGTIDPEEKILKTVIFNVRQKNVGA